MLLKHEASILCAAFSPDGLRLSIGGKCGVITIWDLKTAERTVLGKYHFSRIKKLIYSPQGQFLAGIKDERIFVWNLEKGMYYEIMGKVGLTEIIWSSSEKFIAVISVRYQLPVIVWNFDKNRIYKIKETIVFKNAVRFSPDGQYLAIGSNSNKATIWSCETGNKLFTLESPGGQVRCLEWTNLSDKSIGLALGCWDGSISYWRWDTEVYDLKLIWTSHIWPICMSNLDATGVIGLSPAASKLLKNRGCNKIFISTKKADDVMAERAKALPYDPTNPPRNIFGGEYLLRPADWVVTLVRKKTGKPRRHAFLILESIEDGYHRIRRIDFYLEERQKQGLYNTYGIGCIEIADKGYFDMKALVERKEFVYLPPCEIPQAKGHLLIENIQKDQARKINYFLPGDAVQYQFFRRDMTEQHNCMSWCIKQLRQIDVDIVQNSWLDKIVVYTPSKIPDEEEDKSVTGYLSSKCSIM